MKTKRFYFVQYFYYSDFYKSHVRECGGVRAYSPKGAVKEFLLLYASDKETINYVKGSNKKDCNFIVENTAQNKRYFYKEV